MAANIATQEHVQQGVVVTPNTVSATDKRGMAVTTPQGAAVIQQEQAVNVAPNMASARDRQRMAIATPQGKATLQQEQAVNIAPNRVGVEDKREMGFATSQGAAAIQQQQAVNVAPNVVSVTDKQRMAIETPHAAGAIQQEQAVNIAPNRVGVEDKREMVFKTPQGAAAIQQQQAVNIGPGRVGTEKQQNVLFADSQGTFTLLENERLEIRETSTTVVINGIYNRTNHYIHQSREYVGDAKLTRYINFPGLFTLCLVVMLISLAAPGNYILAFIMAGFNLVGLLIFAQHMYVTVKTMPHMLRLPRVPNDWMTRENGFFEITLEKYQAVFGVQAESGIGIMVAASGTIKLHILKEKAVGYMKLAMFNSTCALIAFFLLLLYCFISGIANLVIIFRR